MNESWLFKNNNHVLFGKQLETIIFNNEKKKLLVSGENISIPQSP